jgi:hypothetical protein
MENIHLLFFLLHTNTPTTLDMKTQQKHFREICMLGEVQLISVMESIVFDLFPQVFVFTDGRAR